MVLTPMTTWACAWPARPRIPLEDAGVGDRLVLELMQRENAALGGEQSAM